MPRNRLSDIRRTRDVRKKNANVGGKKIKIRRETCKQTGNFLKNQKKRLTCRKTRGTIRAIRTTVITRRGGRGQNQFVARAGKVGLEFPCP